MKTKTKQTIKKVVIYALAVLALVGTMAVIGNLSNGFQNLNPKDWNVVERNDKNLIPLTGMEERYRSDVGVNIKQSDGVLTLTGTNKSTADASIAIASFKLPAGTYTFTTALEGINDNTSVYGYYMKLAKASDGSLVANADGTSAFTIAEETEVTLSVVVAPDEKLDNIKLYPAIVEGTEAASYYGNSDKD